MKTFKDMKSREWDLTITTGAQVRVKAATGFFVTDLVKEQSELAEKIVADPLAIPTILFAIIKPAANVAGVGQDDFFDSLDGPILEQAAAALLEGIVDSFQNAQQKEIYRQILTTSEAAVTLMLGEAQKKVQAVTPQMVVDRISTLSDSPTSTPASQA